jgi:hypothetical protein
MVTTISADRPLPTISHKMDTDIVSHLSFGIARLERDREMYRERWVDWIRDRHVDGRLLLYPCQ